MIDKIKITIIITLVILLVIIFFPKNDSKEKEYSFDGKKSGIYLNGDMVTYLDLKEEYKEESAIAKDSEGRDISDKMITSYYKGNKQIFDINTSFAGTYIVKYQTAEKGKTLEASRVVIVNDTEPPVISEVKTKIIKVEEVNSINIEDDIKAKDNSGSVTIRCNNTVKPEPGEYVVKCSATDRYGNKRSIKRLIKVEA